MSNVVVLTHQKYQFFPNIDSKWKQIEDFKNKNKILEKTALANLPLSAKLCDCVQIKQKFSRKFSCSERTLRILLGLILVVLTLGIILIYKPARQLFYKDHVSIKLLQPIRLSDNLPTIPKVTFKKDPIKVTLTFQEIDQVKLQQEIENNIGDIREKNIIPKKLKIFESRQQVFCIPNFPGWIFKTSIDNSEQIIQRSAYTEKIRQVCKKNKFDHLVIPESHLIKVKINGKPVPIIVERMLDIENNPSLQENLYMQHHNEYTLALQQLVHLICQKDLKDIKWENCPLLFDKSTNSFSKIALIDLEPLTGHTDDGLFGHFFGRGIIRCVSPQHFPVIKSIISLYHKDLSEYQKCVQKRLTELQRNRQISQFHSDKGIVYGNELINVDPHDLDLDLEETFENLTMKSAALQTIHYLNQKLAKIPINSPSIKEARVICLDGDEESSSLGKFHFDLSSPKTYKGNPLVSLEDSWLSHIVRALIKKGVLFDIINYTPGRFQVQA